METGTKRQNEDRQATFDFFADAIVDSVADVVVLSSAGDVTVTGATNAADAAASLSSASTSNKSKDKSRGRNKSNRNRKRRARSAGNVSLAPEEVIEQLGSESDVLFVPTIDKNGMPTCYGQYTFKRECDCTWRASCKYYTSEAGAQKRQQTQWQYKHSIALNEGLTQFHEQKNAEWFEVGGEVNIDDVGDDEVEKDRDKDSDGDNGNGDNEADDIIGERTAYDLPGGVKIDSGDVNLSLIKICVWLAIEQPATARAFMLKLDPNISCLQDIADILGVSKQAVHQRISRELGINSRQIKDATLLSMNETEMMVYRLCVTEGKTQTEAAQVTGVSQGMVSNIIAKFRESGRLPYKKKRVRSVWRKGGAGKGKKDS